MKTELKQNQKAIDFRKKSKTENSFIHVVPVTHELVSISF